MIEIAATQASRVATAMHDNTLACNRSLASTHGALLFAGDMAVHMASTGTRPRHTRLFPCVSRQAK
jgi:hypothetical protein